MNIAKARSEAVAAREQLQSGESEKALELIDSVVDELSDTLLTTNEAKDVLGIRSVNTLKGLVRQAGLRIEFHGNRMMIPSSELERLQGTEMVRHIQASDRLHDESAGLGDDEGLSQEELDDLEEGRSGKDPWKA